MSERERKTENPNILMIICHDLGQHLGSYGVDIETPQLDEIAEEGVRFENHFCTAAQCSPSRGSINTGKYPHNNGLIGLAHGDFNWKYDEGEKTLAMYLNEADYETHLFGVQHENSSPDPLGYQYVHPGGSATPVSNRFIEFIKDYGQSETDKPFYASVGFSEPHRPYGRPEYENDDPDEVEPLPYLPDKPGVREDIAGLNGLVYRVDQAVGKIREALRENDLEKDTLLIFTTDHGIAMPRAKGTCYDPGVKTAFLLHKPEEFEGGKVYDELISNVDLLPTLLEYVGGEAPRGIDGRSFLPLLRGEDYSPRDHLYLEMTWHDKYNPMRAIRTKDYKYIRNFGHRPLVYIPADIYRGAAGQEMKDEFYGEKRPEEELYDLREDPLEKENLAEDPHYGSVFSALREQVGNWMRETDDVLLEGAVPPTKEQWRWMERNDVEN